MSDYRHWTSDEEKYIQDHWQSQTDSEMAAALDRSEGAVRTKRRELRCSPQKTWTPEELQYLEDHWGTVSIPGIAKKLGRTVNAIKVRVARMGLGGMLNSGDYVTFNQLMRELTDNSQSYSYQMKSWVKNRGMPIHTKRVNACSFRVVYLEEFWEWAEQHRSFINFSKLEPLALGKEPDWVVEQRRKDYQSFALQRKDPWSPDEDNNLIRLLKQQKYGYAELSELLRRSEGAIVRRCRDLGLKEHFSEESALKMAAQALETTPEALRQSAQFHAGDTVWVLTRDEDGVPNDVDGYMLLAVAGNAVIVTSFVDDQDDLDSTLAYHIRETAVNFDSDLAVFPLSDCYAVYEAARAALDVESEGSHG